MSDIDPENARHFRWEDIPLEPLKGTITRRVISGERMMIAHVHLQKGDEVPRHSHENEQLAYTLKGALHIWLGAADERDVIVRAGELLVIPSQLPHRAIALEDTLNIDIFSPPRQDWLTGTDTYLRA
jgi:quercetin dioxygenase-like cupin family protein